jgi:putative FmdB family regulatory protein
MPTYDYQCKKCGDEFEIFQKITEAPLMICKKCGGEVHRKIGTGAGLMFKGSGFYVTDYKKESPKNLKKDLDQKKSESKTESKNPDKNNKTK